MTNYHTDDPNKDERLNDCWRRTPIGSSCFTTSFHFALLISIWIKCCKCQQKQKTPEWYRIIKKFHKRWTNNTTNPTFWHLKWTASINRGYYRTCIFFGRTVNYETFRFGEISPPGRDGWPMSPSTGRY